MSNPFSKAAAKMAERLRIMESVRPAFVNLFDKTVREMVKQNPFHKDDCIVLELARAAAKAMGLSEDSVKMEYLHNNWKAAVFVHKVSTPMPPPPKKGMPIDPPVMTTTIFKVIGKSGLIDVTYLKVNEENTNIGSDICVSYHQRPNPTNNTGKPSSS